jgi:hypothetical protein
MMALLIPPFCETYLSGTRSKVQEEGIKSWLLLIGVHKTPLSRKESIFQKSKRREKPAVVSSNSQILQQTPCFRETPTSNSSHDVVVGEDRNHLWQLMKGRFIAPCRSSIRC